MSFQNQSQKNYKVFVSLLKLCTLLIIIQLSFPSISLGQNQLATTTSGKKVLLKTDGTWEYVPENTPSSNTNTTNQNHTIKSINNAKKPTPSAKKTTGRTYITGPRGGCYYINSNGNKTYVDRSFCN